MTHSLTMKTEKTSMCNSEWVREAARQAAAAAATPTVAAITTTTATNSQAQRVSTVNTKKKKSIPLLALENYKNHEQRKGHH